MVEVVPASSSRERLQTAAAEIHAVCQLLEAMQQVPAEHWLEAQDGMKHLTVAMERLAGVLAVRAPK